MHDRLKLALAVSGCIVLGFGGATATVAMLETSAEAGDPVRARAPEGGVRISAQTNNAEDHALGVATYRSEEGKRCFDAGHVVRGQLGSADPDGDFHPTPLEETGMCTVPGAPVALSMSDDHDDLSRVVVSGLAPLGSTQVQVSSPQGQVTSRPAEDGAFIVTLPAAMDSEVRVRVTLPGGSIKTERLRRLRAPDPEEARREAMQNEGRDHADR